MKKFMYKNNAYKRGFTLIELLVVIAIIGTLASVILASLSTAREKARDARRATDIRQLQIALEMYYHDNGGIYPTDGADLRISQISGSLTPTHIPTIPEDPVYTGNNSYRYWAANNGKSYTMLVDLEGDATQFCAVRVNSPAGWNNQTTYPPCAF